MRSVASPSLYSPRRMSSNRARFSSTDLGGGVHVDRIISIYTNTFAATRQSKPRAPQKSAAKDCIIERFRTAHLFLQGEGSFFSRDSSISALVCECTGGEESEGGGSALV